MKLKSYITICSMALSCLMAATEASATEQVTVNAAKKESEKTKNEKPKQLPAKTNGVNSGREHSGADKTGSSKMINHVNNGGHNSSTGSNASSPTPGSGSSAGTSSGKPGRTVNSGTGGKGTGSVSAGNASNQGYFKVSDNDRNIYMGSDSEERTVRVNCNAAGKWEVTSDHPYWLSVYRDGSTLIINADRNSSKEARHASIVLSGNNGGRTETQVIHVQQNGHTEFRALDLEFCNVKDYNAAKNYNRPLISSDMRLLGARLVYEGPENRTKKTLRVRIYRPDGTMEHLPESPYGYTWETKANITAGARNYEELPMWGSDSRSNFPPGTYKYEVYDGDKLLISKNLTINAASGQKTATIQSVTVEQNATNNGVSGIRVHTNVHAINLKGRKIRLCVFLNKSDDTPCPNADGRQASYQDTTVPDYDDSTYSDWSVFIPYSDLRSLGYRDLKFFIQVQDDLEYKLLSSSKGHSLGW